MAATGLKVASISPDGTWFDGYYAPMITPSFIRKGGQELHFLMTHWRVFHPVDEIYNVSLYRLTMTRRAAHASCVD